MRLPPFARISRCRANVDDFVVFVFQEVYIHNSILSSGSVSAPDLGASLAIFDN